jgi:hypothetical protein
MEDSTGIVDMFSQATKYVYMEWLYLPLIYLCSQPRAGPSTIGRFPSQRQPPLYKLALDSNQRDSHRLLQLPGLWDFKIRQSRRLDI